MQLNKTTDYAMRILHYLGQEKRVVPSSEMAKNMKISQRYLINVARELKTHGYISVGLGPEGGYSLAKPMNTITLYDVITLMEGKIIIARCCNDGEHCSNDGLCILHDAYLFLESILESYLRSLTLDMAIDLPISDWHSTIMEKLYAKYCLQNKVVPNMEV